MEAKATTFISPTLPVAKQDLLATWTTLERLVVSLRRIGSEYASPDAQTPIPAEQHKAMLEAIDEFFDIRTIRELSQARRTLAGYLPDEETEHLSENVIRYWEPKK